jgi:hypothetical protein
VTVPNPALQRTHTRAPLNAKRLAALHMANKPTHIDHSVRDFAKKDGEEDSPWTRIGAGFVHKDGQGFQYRA